MLRWLAMGLYPRKQAGKGMLLYVLSTNMARADVKCLALEQI